jgi:hypothetical protein
MPQQIDYDALARQHGGSAAQAEPIDYDKLAQAHGGTSADNAPAAPARGGLTRPLTSVVAPEIAGIRKRLNTATELSTPETPITRVNPKTGTRYASTQGTAEGAVKGAVRGAGGLALDQAEMVSSPLGAILTALPYLRGLLKARPPNPVLAPTKTAGPLGNTAKVTGVQAGGGELVLPELPSTMPGRVRPVTPPMARQTGTGSLTGPPPTGPMPETMPLPARPPVRPEGVQTGTGSVVESPAGPIPTPEPARSAWPGAERTPLEVAQAKARAALAEVKPVKTVDDFAAMMKEKGAVVGEALKTGASTAAEAADEIERSVKQGIKELRDLEGSEKAGARIFGTSKTGGILDPAQRKAVIKQIAPGPSKTPKVAEEAMNKAALKQAFDNEKGGVNPKLLGSIAGGIAGGATGATQGDTTEERVQNAFLGGAAGALAVPMIAHAYAVGAPKAIQNILYTSVLSSPQSVIRAYSGAAGGTIGKAAEMIAVGQVKQGTAILQALFSKESFRTFTRAMWDPKSATLSGMAGEAPTFIGRIFGAGDAVARRAMAAGGVSADEAARYTLSGTPTTVAGQRILQLWSDFFPLRLATTLFPRVGIQALERAAERSPLGLVKGFKGLNVGASQGTRVARAAMGTGVGLAGATLNDTVPDYAKPYVVAAMGVYGLPMSVGMAIMEGAKKGDPVTAPLEAFSRNLPFPQYGPVEGAKQLATGASFVPNILRDVARAQDPYERKTDVKSGGFFARTKAKIPGLRETLPVKGANMNIAGQPNQDRSSAATRFLSSANPQQDKWQDVPAKVQAELKRLDVEVNAPSFNAYKRDKRLGAIDIPPDILERSRVERRQYLLPFLERAMASPGYQASDDAKKKRILEAAKNRAEAAGSAKARAKVIKALRESGKL